MATLAPLKDELILPDDIGQYDREDIVNAHQEILRLVRQGLAFGPRIETELAAGNIQRETQLARNALGYLEAAFELLRRFAILHRALISHPDMMALRRQLKRYNGA